jgi:hypothetical protein
MLLFMADSLHSSCGELATNDRFLTIQICTDRPLVLTDGLRSRSGIDRSTAAKNLRPSASFSVGFQEPLNVRREM